MQLLTMNSKLRKTSKLLGVKVFNFGIPAYKSASGKLTCPFADECIKFCYAQKGAYVWSNVKPAFEKRYELTRSDEFVSKMSDELFKKRPDYVRIHDSGDYYSKSYLQKWIDIANLFPEIKFYSYTNSVAMLKEANLPSNFDVIFSDSGKQKNMIDVINDRHTKIFSSKQALEDAGYVNASELDLYATKWFSNNNKVGLVFH
jgi:hypothetical protein